MSLICESAIFEKVHVDDTGGEYLLVRVPAASLKEWIIDLSMLMYGIVDKLEI